MAPDEKMNKIGRSEKELLDYISRLPESVIHHILSFLPFEHIVRSSVLSKTWNRIWSSYPNIDLSLHFQTYTYTRPRFLNLIERILDQCLLRKNCIQKLQFSISFPNLEELASVMDRWLRAAIERNVSELVIKIRCSKEFVDDPKVLYSIPEEVVIADSLKVLELEDCMFEDRFACIVLPRLRTLKLFQCHFVGDNVLNKILCGCPELEFLEVLVCEGVGSCLSVSCKPRFKYFHVGCVKELERIEILAPSLETFKFHSMNPCVLDLASCTVLKHLELDGAVLSSDYVPIQYLLSKLVYIEELQLLNCRAVDKIKISSSCLKRLVMGDYVSFPGAEIDIPNLLRLDFFASGVFNSGNQFSSWNLSKVEEIHMAFSFKSFQTVCKAGLKGFLMKLHNYEVLKLLIQYKGCQNLIMLEKLHAVPFSSLNKFLKKTKPEYVLISSRRDENFFTRMLVSKSSPVSLSLIFSSRQSIELLYKKLSNDAMLQSWYSDFRLVSTQEIENEMDSAWKSFMKTRSPGYETATIILYRRSLENMVARFIQGRLE